MYNRRKFLKASATTALAASLPYERSWAGRLAGINGPATKVPVVVSTWNHGLEANEAAWEILAKGGRALDAVEVGVRVPEADPGNMSVGRGGLPDAEGKVTLDACIMDENGKAGAVCFLEHIVHPVSVARLVMERTPHVMLAGEGALKFALEMGFEKEDLLTEKAREEYEMWLRTGREELQINRENHDTIGMLALDLEGNLSGACTTSGLAYKYRGRVGDSPIIGAGLYVDNEVGGAVATGMGELVMTTLGSFLIVELMRNGLSPGMACKEAISRIVNKYGDLQDLQVGFVALNKAGESGACAIHRHFNYALMNSKGNQLIDSPYIYE